MIHDARVEVTCDGQGCSESCEVQPDYVYQNYSGNSGYYDCDEKSLAPKIEAEGWKIVDSKHLCESCAGTDTESEE